MANTNLLTQAYYKKIIHIYELSLAGLSDAIVHQHLNSYDYSNDKMKAYVDVRYYITQSIRSLHELFNRYEIFNEANKTLAVNLFNYLVNVNDYLPDSKHGVMGYADDAWLIHNVLYRFHKSNETPDVNFSCDWNRIIKTNEIIIDYIPSNILGKMQQLLIEHLDMLPLNIRKPLPDYRSVNNNFQQNENQFRGVRFGFN